MHCGCACCTLNKWRAASGKCGASSEGLRRLQVAAALLRDDDEVRESICERVRIS